MRNKIVPFFVATCAALAQTTINGSRTITGAWDASGATSTKPSKMGTSLPGTCTVGESYVKTDAAAASQLYLCTSSNTWTAQGGGGAAAAVAVSFAPWGAPGYVTSATGASAAGVVDIIQFSTGTAIKFKAIGFDIVTPATSNCNGGAGACGGSAGIYSWDGSAFQRVCVSDPVYTGHTTAEYNIATAEGKRFLLTSGSAFSGGFCELSAGNWYVGYTFESTALVWSVLDTSRNWYVMNTYSGAIRAPAPGRFRTSSAAVATGTGATYSVPSSFSSLQVLARKLPLMNFFSE